MGKVAAILACIVILVLFGAAGWMAWESRQNSAVATKAQAQAGAAVVGQGQAQAQAAAQQIVVSGQARDSLDIHVHQDNANAIAQAPGASQPLDPAALRAARVGLCRHPSLAADPECSRLLSDDPAELPQAGSVGSAARP